MSLHKIQSSDPISRHTHGWYYIWQQKKSILGVLAPPPVHLYLVSMNSGWILSRLLLLSRGFVISDTKVPEGYAVVRSDLHSRNHSIIPVHPALYVWEKDRYFRQTLVYSSHFIVHRLPLVIPGVVRSLQSRKV